MKSKLLIALLLLPAFNVFAEDTLTIADDVPYYDKNIIQGNVLNECSSLGSELSTHIAESLQKNGVTATRVSSPDFTQGTALEVQITTLASAGNAFFGHHKSISVRAKLYKENQVLKENTFTRDSMGGAFGGFKGSCSVLDRVAIALGKDIAQWYNTNRP